MGNGLWRACHWHGRLFSGSSGSCVTPPELRALAAGSQGRSALMKPLRYFVALTLVAGMCLTGRALYLHAKAEVAGVLIRRPWQATSRRGESPPPWPWADTHP